jgi:hypothetical protein
MIMEPNIPTNSEPQIPIQPIVLPVQPTTEPIQVPVEQNFEPTKKSLPKWPLIIVGVILLATLLTGTYLLGKNQGINQKPTANQTQKVVKSTLTPTPTSTPTPDLTTSWKTYTNTKVGFSIRYPYRFSQPELPSGPGPTIYADGTEVKTEIVFGVTNNDSFSIIPVPFTSNLEDFLKAEQNSIVKTDAHFMGIWYGDGPKTIMKTISVNNLPDATLYKSASGNFKEAHVLLPNQYILIFRTNTQQNESEFETIIKSLRFTP